MIGDVSMPDDAQRMIQSAVQHHGRIDILVANAGVIPLRTITEATAAANFPLLAAGVLTMSLALVALNRTVWKRLYRIADERFSLNR